MWGITIKALAEMFASIFNWRTASVGNQETTEILKDKRGLEEACSYAERAFEVVERGATFRKAKHQRRYRSYVRRFRDMK